MTSFDRRDLSPMRMADAEITLGVVAARRGDLETAQDYGTLALSKKRVCGPSLLVVGSELDDALRSRYPQSAQSDGFHEALVAATRGASA